MRQAEAGLARSRAAWLAHEALWAGLQELLRKPRPPGATQVGLGGHLTPNLGRIWPFLELFCPFGSWISHFWAFFPQNAGQNSPFLPLFALILVQSHHFSAIFLSFLVHFTIFAQIPLSFCIIPFHLPYLYSFPFLAFLPPNLGIWGSFCTLFLPFSLWPPWKKRSHWLSCAALCRDWPTLCPTRP